MKILVILLLVGATYADDSVFSRIRDGGYGRRYDHRPVIRHDVIRDDCYPNPCLNHGVCLTSSSNGWDRSWGSVDYYCKCPHGYSGKRCGQYQPPQDYCYPNPCRNHGVCLTSSSNGWDRSWGSVNYYCKCPRDYSGRQCEHYESQDYCHPNPCRNYGVCLTSSSRGWNPTWGSVEYYCKCPTGYSGRQCEHYRAHDIQGSCGPYDCKHGGHCVWKHGVQICQCPPSWGGPQCESRKYY